MAQLEMRALQRYALLGFLVVSFVAGVAILHIRSRPPQNVPPEEFQIDRLSSFWSGYHFKWTDRGRNISRNTDNHPELCRFHSCFDFDRCRSGFRVYIYPLEDGQAASATYMKLLSAIRRSRFYTPNPDEACLFVPNVDTLDR